jgi:hypothetical protein
MYGPGIPCLDPDKPLTREELDDERRELYPDEEDDDDAEEE